MLKIAITGSTGLVGSRLINLLKTEFKFIPLGREVVDITQKNQVWQKINQIDFDLFLHLAAYTNVDGAEKEKSLAWKINVEGTKNVFEVSLHKKKKFIYVSTDFVFDGNNPPYFEGSLPRPISYYGLTKYEGEKIVKDKAMIVRIAYPYRASFEPKKDFVRTIKFLLEQKKPVFMVKDSLITPTFIDDIVFALKHLFKNYSCKVFHLVGSESLSPCDCGKLISKAFNLDGSLVQPTTYSLYFKNKAKRPRYSVIKTKNNEFYKMKSFEQGLKELLSYT